MPDIGRCEERSFLRDVHAANQVFKTRVTVEGRIGRVVTNPGKEAHASLVRFLQPLFFFTRVGQMAIIQPA